MKHWIQIDICSNWQDEAVHGRTELLAALGGLVLLGLLLGALSLLESSAWPPIHLLGERLQVLFSSLRFTQSSLYQAAQDAGHQQDKLSKEDN